MRGIPFYFIATAAILGLGGMIWGIIMSASQDHSLSPAHAHLNLIGWVTMALFGFYYHLVPAAASNVLAKIHYALATLGVILIVPGIVMALQRTGEGLAKAGSAVTVLSMLVFVVTVFRHSRA